MGKVIIIVMEEGSNPVVYTTIKEALESCLGSRATKARCRKLGERLRGVKLGLPIEYHKIKFIKTTLNNK
jgi:hypothetical protein